ncbi:MAG: FAD-dependent oxidoreductase, partial [Anaerolineae bacterium]
DFYAGRERTVPRHVFYNRKAALEKFPRLNPDVLFAALYYDGAMPSPERIAIELIRDAVAANAEAVPLNYVRAVGADGQAVYLKDEIGGEMLEIRPRIVVNAAGPWIDRVNRCLGADTRFIGGTKGSHLVLDHPELRQAIGEHEFFFENDDGRIVLIYPLFDRVMIGTSDIRIENPDEAVITEEEVDYFFSMIRRVFPDIEVNRSHIVFTFSGVRPLRRMQTGTTGQISRDHKVQVLPAGEALDVPVLSLVGGKWTSFRAFSEEAADAVLRFLGRERRLSTRDLPIGGGKGWPADETARQTWLDRLVGRYGGERELVSRLLNRYGTLVENLLEQQGVNALAPLSSLPEYTRGEIAWLASSEDVQHLDDLLLRRTMIAMLGRLTPRVLDEVAAICAAECHWSAAVLAAEKTRLLSLLRARHRMDYNRYAPD